MSDKITLDVKAVSIGVCCFLLGNLYGTLTTMKATKRNIMLIKGNIIK